MREGMNRISHRRFAVGRCMRDHIISHYNEDFLGREKSAQTFQVSGVRDIDRHIVREEKDTGIVRN